MTLLPACVTCGRCARSRDAEGLPGDVFCTQHEDYRGGTEVHPWCWRDTCKGRTVLWYLAQRVPRPFSRWCACGDEKAGASHRWNRRCETCQVLHDFEKE